MTDHNLCPHQWTQPAPSTPAWVLSMPSTKVCPECPEPIHTVTPNPVFPITATLPTYTPLEIKKIDPCTALVTVSIPTESTITLPTQALEIKKIRKNLMITQCRFFDSFPAVCGIPHDTPKLFLGGYVRKDIQYTEAIRQTSTTVEGIVKDFVIQIPFTCVIDLPCLYAKSRSHVHQTFQNSLQTWNLVFSEINEMDDALDRVPLLGGPYEEGVFKVLQEKMIILIQLRLTFPTAIDPPHPPCHCRHCSKPCCDDYPATKACCHHSTVLSTTTKLLKSVLRCMSR